jgi:hypothetical protein
MSDWIVAALIAALAAATWALVWLVDVLRKRT